MQMPPHDAAFLVREPLDRKKNKGWDCNVLLAGSDSDDLLFLRPMTMLLTRTNRPLYWYPTSSFFTLNLRRECYCQLIRDKFTAGQVTYKEPRPAAVIRHSRF